jgi:hypothetical protein
MKNLSKISIRSSSASAQFDYEQFRQLLQEKYSTCKRTKTELSAYDSNRCVSSHLYGQMCAYKDIAKALNMELMA